MNTSSILTRRAVRACAIALTAAAAALGGTAAAHASTGGSYWEDGYYVALDTQAHWITASYDGLNVAVADGSMYAGTRLIQWYNDGAAEQKWYFDQVYDADGGFEGYLLRNENSGQCMSTDGRAGDSVFQEACNPALLTERFWHYGSPGTNNSFQNRYTGLYLDVSGGGYGAGTNIDLWYYNNHGNQTFWVSNVSS